jgi:formylglycine-generating enzyme required for sulfatase activity
MNGVCINQVCALPICTDAVRNGDETDTDCGGGTCGPCGYLKNCVAASDCISADCKGGFCLAGCTDTVKNGLETDLDCGGPCKGCLTGKACIHPNDCLSGVCVASLCVAPTCVDTVRNGTETDVDCGSTCPKCVNGNSCAVGTDCASGVCANLTCQVPACNDGVKNGIETDIDCGGGSCAPCGSSGKCVLSSDCTSGVCKTGTCAAPVCNDLVKNGSETDVDCGGAACPKCATLKACTAATDCLSNICVNKVCQDGSCTDSQKNNTETDIDCGGASCSACGTALGCLVNTDCQSGKCNVTTKLCSSPNCTDAIKNGTETDVDCGGGGCGLCANGKVCLAGSDCGSKVCGGFPLVCQAANCSDGVLNGNETDIDCGGSCPKCAHAKACGSAADCATGTCVNYKCGCPSSMITIPILLGGDYCIDKYEISYDEYEAFWGANPVPSGQLPECSGWNTTYTPPENWPAPLGTGTYPIRNVDWCDAYAYCKWAGKRLCGKIKGGPSDYTGYADKAVSQWYAACSAQGANFFPYGQTFVANKCNDGMVLCGTNTPKSTSGPISGNRTSSVQPPPAWTACTNQCQGGAPELFDMSGNVAEWENSCSATSGELDTCRTRGGSYYDGETGLRCDAATNYPRNTTSADLGIRCCID